MVRIHDVMTTVWRGVALSALTTAVSPALAADPPQLELHQPAQPLGQALRAVAVASGVTVLVDAPLVEGLAAPTLDGRYTLDQALAVLLERTGLIVKHLRGAIVIQSAGEAGIRDTDPDVVVTGSRIRGTAPIGANLIVLDRKAIDRSGYATTQQLLQALPQNFGGGPNDSTTGVSVRNNTSANTGLGSSINLRGLGAASTLVLVDGNRPRLTGCSARSAISA